ncbi:MAG: hypothetical protein ACFE0P_15435 [Oceanicaulis sp.]
MASFLKIVSALFVSVALIGCTTSTPGGANVNLGCAMTGLCSMYSKAEPELAGPEWSEPVVRDPDPDSIVWAQSLVRRGDVIRSNTERFGVHAVLRSPLPAMERPWIPEFPSGTVFYPVSYANRGVPTSLTSMALNDDVVTPTSWCTAAADPERNGQEIAYCLFFRNASEYMVRSSRTGSAWHVPAFSEGSAIPRAGEVDLEVVREPLPRVLERRLEVDHIRGRRVSFIEVINDGVASSEVRELVLRADDAGLIALPDQSGFRTYRLVRDDDGPALAPVTQSRSGPQSK